MSYLNKLKEKIGGEILGEAPAEAAKDPSAASAGSTPPIQPPVLALPAELNILVDKVGRLHGFDADQLTEAKTIASGDVDGALACFRALVSQVNLPAPARDYRVTCSTCKNLIRGQCRAAAQGLMEDTYRGYCPVQDVPRHCEHYSPKGH